jgi:hypothetical protein
VIVLAESNFVLELALRQEQFEHAQRILGLAEEKHLRLRALHSCGPFRTFSACGNGVISAAKEFFEAQTASAQSWWCTERKDHGELLPVRARLCAPGGLREGWRHPSAATSPALLQQEADD